MPLKNIHQLPDAPIIIMEYEGNVTSEDVIASDATSTPLMTNLNGDVCLIIDTRASMTSFSETLKILQHYATNRPERETHFEVQVMFVGTDAMTKFAADSTRLKQFGGTAAPLFATMEDAVAAARQWAVNKKAGVETQQSDG